MTLHVFVAGELLKAPEQRTASTGNPFVSALVRVDADTVVSLTCFDTALAEKLAALKRGSALACSGRLSAKPYSAQDGTLRPGLSVVVTELMHGSMPPQRAAPKPRGDRSQRPVGAGASGTPFDDELPPSF